MHVDEFGCMEKFVFDCQQIFIKMQCHVMYYWVSNILCTISYIGKVLSFQNSDSHQRWIYGFTKFLESWILFENIVVENELLIKQQYPKEDPL